MFEDRADAANKLCPKLSKFSNREDVVIVGLMRGGVITASIISKALKLKLKPLIVKKISDSANSELAIGAIISPKVTFLNERLIKKLNISEFTVNKLILEKWQEIQTISKKFKTSYQGFEGKTAIIVDDGVATGASVLVAENFLRLRGTKKIILATPVIASDTYKLIQKYFDEIIYLIKENNFYAVGQFYKNFEQVSDEKVRDIIQT